ncbi:MAG: mechanosensitive ion channel protein MscS [Rhodospirillales bacterium CG15_BIG_FIL_POST_REV_8_21_14_020_66_15]|nr:MAG: mechanosensitive ion channel protein MscS [Rhodospirillales bacterium CG15_BIG_FIL_POST_REV_8_21_14_020_66_15]
MNEVEKTLEQNVQQVAKWVDVLIEFGVTYGFQILGALLFLIVGLKAGGWLSRRIQAACEAKGIDVTLSRFIGNVVKILILTVLAIITLGNFGISIAPLIALAGASAFGATMALQGPLSNYGAGLSIILARPFVVGNTITVGETSGVVDEVKMAHTRLVGEDGERITIPNKDIVGRVIVNSETRRVVQTKVALAAAADLERAVEAARKAVAKALPPAEDGAGGAEPQVGLHDFTFGGLVLGVRFWVPSSRYYELRYKVNQAVLEALRAARVPLLQGVQPAVAADSLSGDGMPEGRREEN